RSDTPPLLRRLINEYPEWKEQIVKGMVSRGGLSGLSAILSEFNTPFGTASGTTIQWNTEEKFLTGLFLIENSPVPVERLLLVLPAVLSQWETAKWDAKTPSLMLIRCLEEMASQDFNKVGLRPMASGRVYADFLPLLESARKTGRADSIACIARFFRKIAADPKLDPAQKEALHDAIIAGLNHADPEVRAAFNQIHFKEYLPGKPPPAGGGSSGALGLALGIGAGLATFLGSDGAHAAVEASAHVFYRGDLRDLALFASGAMLLGLFGRIRTCFQNWWLSKDSKNETFVFTRSLFPSEIADHLEFHYWIDDENSFEGIVIKDVQIGEHHFAKGDHLGFHDGRLAYARFHQARKFGPISSTYRVFFHENGKLQSALSASPQTLEGKFFAESAEIWFDTQGRLMASSESKNGERLRAFAPPTLLGMDFLLNGQATFTGTLLAGLATLASSGMVLGVFDWLGRWIKVLFHAESVGEPTIKPDLEDAIISPRQKAKSLYREKVREPDPEIEGWIDQLKNADYRVR